MTKSESEIRNLKFQIVWPLFAIFTIFVYFFGLDIPFVGPDEPRYAQVAREMLERGDWITPTLGGHPWFEKPVLLYWLEMASYKLFGVSEFAARFGPALFGLGTIASLWILGRNLNRDNTDGTEKSFANCLALIAASTLGIIVFARGASFDIIVTFPITASLVSFFVFHQSAASSFKKRFFALACFYFFIGVALLAKGLIGMLIPFGVVALFYVISRRLPSRVFIVSLFWGTLLASGIASVWYLPMYLTHGDRFIDEFFIQHHFQRFISNKYQHPQPFYFYLWVLPLMTLPWLPFFLASLWKTFQHGATENIEDAENKTRGLPFSFSPLLLFSAAWLLVPLVFFSISGSKLPGYILPAVPAAIIFAAVYVFESVEKSARWRRAVVLTAASTFAVVILLIILAVPKYAETDSVMWMIKAANERGYSANKVLTLHTVSHNAEFYAAGRLLRDADGKQRQLSGVDEVMNELAQIDNRTALVLVPIDALSQLTTDTRLKTESLKDNGDLAVVAVTIR